MVKKDKKITISQQMEPWWSSAYIHIHIQLCDMLYDKIGTFTCMVLLQGHGCERMVQKTTAGPVVPGPVLHHRFLPRRDSRQPCDSFTDIATQRLSYAVQHYCTCRLYRINQGKFQIKIVSMYKFHFLVIFIKNSKFYIS